MSIEIDRARGGGRGGAGDSTDRVLPHIPNFVPEFEPGRLRSKRVFEEVQWSLLEPQLGAQTSTFKAPKQILLYQDHVRRFLQPIYSYATIPSKLRYVRTRIYSVHFFFLFATYVSI